MAWERVKRGSLIFEACDKFLTKEVLMFKSIKNFKVCDEIKGRKLRMMSLKLKFIKEKLS